MQNRRNWRNTLKSARLSPFIEKWNPSRSATAASFIELFFSNKHAQIAVTGLTHLLVLANQAKAELQTEIEMPEAEKFMMNKKIFIGHGRSGVWYQL